MKRMRKEEKEELLRKICGSIELSKFSDEEKKILGQLPFFVKEMIPVLDKVIEINSNFEVKDVLEINFEDKNLRFYIVKVLHDSHSSLCIKFAKIFEPGKTIFLGFKGLDFLTKEHYERINNLIFSDEKSESYLNPQKLYSFASKKSNSKDYIPGVTKDHNHKNRIQRIMPSLDFSLKTGNYFVVFKEI